MAVCIFIYPEMQKQMDSISDMFSQMGAFTAAFGMDTLNFGELTGYYAIECGNVIGLGGAFFAALVAIESISKEERDKTSEFLLVHPISRTNIISQKLLSVIVRVLVLNVVVFLAVIISIAAIGEPVPMKEMILLHLAYFLVQLVIAGICFGISAFISKGSLGIGMGVALLFYVINLIANLDDSVEGLSYLTPFGFCEGSDIIANLSLDGVRIAIMAAAACVCTGLAYVKYPRKDIAA